MSSKQPSLADLGLDGPIDKPFGKAFDNYDSSKEQSASWVDTVKLPPSVEKSGLAAVLSFVVPGLGQIYRGRILSGVLAVIFFGLLYSATLAFWPLALLAVPAHVVNIYSAFVS